MSARRMPMHITEVEREIAHAVAIERNRCLDIIDAHLEKLDRAAPGHEDVARHMEAMRVHVVRERIAGHNPQPATSGDTETEAEEFENE